MNNKSAIRVRFAPAPTGLMHLGNVRTALMNYLFAQQKKGTFIIRIEDTDTQRNFDPEAKKIIDDIHWLGLDYNEGPQKGGPDEPYFQSQRTFIYEEYIQKLADKKLIYHCFCTPDELEKKRQRQIALKQPPRYDRTCLKRSPEEINDLLNKKTPFIWRVLLDQNASITITDLAHGKITFEFKNFSDFPITRADGTITFLFANFVDDMVMKMSHVIRGEDHLTNTANQAALYTMLNVPLPIFWHLPILCNAEGKKLSKRDFGFSLNDLINTGYLPEAIDNYLAIIGGGTFEQEIMSLPEIAQHMNFEHIHSTGHVRYDVEKLRWLNHKWISKLEPQDLMTRALPFLLKTFPQASQLNPGTLCALLQTIKTDLYILSDVSVTLSFIFEAPLVDVTLLPENHTLIGSVITSHIDEITNPDNFMSKIKDDAKKQNIPIKNLFGFLRLALIGKENGPSIHELIAMLGTLESRSRIEKLL